MHITTGRGGYIGSGEGAHDLVTDGLYDGALMFLDHPGQDLNRLCDLAASQLVPQRVIQLCAAADIGKDYGKICGFLRHVSGLVFMGSSPRLNNELSYQLEQENNNCKQQAWRSIRCSVCRAYPCHARRWYQSL